MKGDQIRTILIVTLVTLLVWLFAESRTLRIETITVPVEIAQGGRTLAFRLTEATEWNAVAELEISGPAGLIDEIRVRALEGIKLELGAELPNEPGVRSVDMREAIRRDEVFAESGVRLRRVKPDSIGLEIDRLETMMLPVEADLTGVETAGAVTVEPAEIEIHLPVSYAGGEIHAVAKIDISKLSAMTPGRRAELSQVPVELVGLPDGVWGLRVLETWVTVSLTLRARTESLQLPELPVYVEMAPADLALWSVEIPPEDRVLSGLTLTGTGAVIERVRRGELRLRAVVSITSEDLERGVERVVVELVGLPPGVVVDLDGREVRVVVNRRAAESSD